MTADAHVAVVAVCALDAEPDHLLDAGIAFAASSTYTGDSAPSSESVKSVRTRIAESF